MTFTRRHLPHWHPPDTEVFITWRLHGTLPAKYHSHNISDSPGKCFLGFDKLLDQAQNGPLWLKDDRIAECVISQLQALHHKGKFVLSAYVVMANHVHVLLAPKSPLAQITQRIKGATAREANLILRQTETPFWQDESFDHWIRNPGEWQQIRTYIEANPVKAGLVTIPQDWPWSSASKPIAPQ
jgi:REP element-mobilizing transposase RayT